MRSASLRRGLSVSLVAAGLVLMVVPDGGRAAAMGAGRPRTVTATPGQQGTDTRIADTPSALTISGRGAFSGMSFHLNQTQNLSNQAITVSWTGGTVTGIAPTRYATDYVQIFQCWGDDDGTNPANPGPPPEQCEQGAVGGKVGGATPADAFPNGYAMSRIISTTGWANHTDPYVVAHGVADPTDRSRTLRWIPFRAVDGTVVNVQTDQTFNPLIGGGNYWLNPYYNNVTTNEVPAAATMDDGTGFTNVQTVTAVESAGLGCGAKVLPAGGSTKKEPKCWLVIVPRGGAASENAGTPFPDDYGVYTSPLGPTAWRNRIAIPLTFNPVESPCNLAGDQLRISGSEPSLQAVASWQVALCGRSDLLPFSYAPVSDESARLQLQSGIDGGPSMVAVMRPLTAGNDDPTNPVVYTPLTQSGLVIGFTYERYARLDAPDAEKRLAGVPVASLHLTPRLVAKLLTQSYGSAVLMNGPPPYSWVSTTPSDLAVDPDFLRFNPEFQLLYNANRREFSNLSVEASNSDAARLLWQWVLADPEAKRWMAGAADEWGMKVNPVYLTTRANPTGIPFGDPIPTAFPKSEPHCFQADPTSTGFTPPLICGTDWNPFSGSFLDSARVVSQAFDGAKLGYNTFANGTSDIWKKGSPPPPGNRVQLGVMDTAAAIQFGVQMASLSRSGDDGADRSFIAPTTASITTGVKAMRATSVAGVREVDFGQLTTGAYPLPLVSYAAVKPLRLTTAERRQFAELLKFVAGAGQTQGVELGQLPRGYVQFDVVTRAKVVAAANRIMQVKAPVVTTTTTTYQPTYVTPTPAPTEVPTTVSSTPATTTATTSTVATSTTVVETATSLELTPLTPASGGRLVLPGLGLAATGGLLGAVGITVRARPRRRK